MEINDRIVVAANGDGSMKALHVDLEEEAEIYKKNLKAYEKAKKRSTKTGEELTLYPTIHPLADILQEPHHKDIRAVGNAKKLSRIFDGSRLAGDDSVSTLMGIVLNEDFIEEIDLRNQVTCRTALTDDRYAGKIILVTLGGGTIHAEQKLLYALHLSGSKSAASIFGKKRPCAGCSLTLRFAREKMGLNITFNERPGGYFGPALPGLDKLVQAHLSTGTHDKVALLEWLHETVLQKIGTMHLSDNLTKKKNKRKDLADSAKEFKNKGSINANQSGYDSASDSEPDESSDKHLKKKQRTRK